MTVIAQCDVFLLTHTHPYDQHRIGRTGRFGRKGTAINFCDSDEAIAALADIEKYYKDGQEMIHQVAADPEALAGAIEI